jgi:phospholipid N-methyltransferase
MSLTHSIRFFRRWMSAPTQVGAVAPSSPALAAAVTEPFARRSTPARVLEVGAGTGSFTRRLGELLGPEDRLDICEIDQTFVHMLEGQVAALPALKTAKQEGRLRLLHCPVQDIDTADAYDYVISGLPLNGFEPGLVTDVLACIERVIKPAGTFSYFEYVWLRRWMHYAMKSATRRRIRAVSEILDAAISKYEISRTMVLNNVPPAYARHWCFMPPTRRAH